MDTTFTLPGSLQANVDEAIARAVGERWASRIWARDTSLWTDDEQVAATIARRLGWLDAPTAFQAEVAELLAFDDEIEREGYTDVLVCGMGASSLVPRVLSRVYPESEKGLRLHVLDSTDPAAVARYDELLEPGRTLFVIAARAGVTTETLAFLSHVWRQVEQRVGRFPRSRAGNEFVSVSDPGEALDAIPHASYFRETFLDPAGVGGRYSALTYVGLVPAALLHLDLDPLLEDAAIVAEASRADSADNAPLVLGAAMAALARAGRDKLTFVIEPDLAPLGAWLEQLVAESTGSHGGGIVPVEGEPLGVPGAYGEDRLFVRLGPASDSEWHADVDSKLAALAQAGHPLIDIRLDDASWVGAEFFRWQFATAAAGIGLGVDPFAEPDVDASTHGTNRLLDIHAREGKLPTPAPSATRGVLRAWGESAVSDVGALLREHVGRTPQRGYLHVGAWVAPTNAHDEQLRALQAQLRDATRLPTTVGYGPRYLHVSGQLHKRGTPTGCFIQLTSGHPADREIPGRRETFGVLIDAQAAGELEALRARELPVLRIDLGDDAEAGLAALQAVVAEALA